MNRVKSKSFFTHQRIITLIFWVSASLASILLLVLPNNLFDTTESTWGILSLALCIFNTIVSAIHFFIPLSAKSLNKTICRILSFLSFVISFIVSGKVYELYTSLESQGLLRFLVILMLLPILWLFYSITFLEPNNTQE